MVEEASVQDNAAEAPQEEPIEFVPAGQAEAAPEPQEVPTQKILGKFEKPEDVIPAYQHLEQEKGRLSNELGQLRQMVQQLQSQGQAPAPPAYGGPNPEAINEQFREQLDRDPFGTLMQFSQMVAQQTYAQQQAAQKAALQKFQQYAQDPAYAEVAAEAAQMFPFSEPVPAEEAAFLRAKVAHLEKLVKSGGQAPKSPTPFVEGGGASRSGGGYRVELDDKGVQFRQKVGDQRTAHLARMIAARQAEGKDMRSMSIDEWEKFNAK